MFAVLLTLAVIAVVAWSIFKNYYPPTVLLLAGLLFLAVAAFFGVDPVAAKKSTHFLGFDFAQAFTDQMKTRLPGLGLNIMWIAGFSVYMDRIGASKALVKACVRPLAAIRSPYVLLGVTYVIGQFMALFINSAVGLGLLLMASIFPLLVELGVSRTSAAAVIGSTCCLDLGPSSSNSMRAADLLNIDVVTYFVQNQLPVAICVIITVAVGHFFVQRWFDRRDGETAKKENAEGTQQDVNKAFEGAGPAYYAILPMLPLVLLIIFSPMVYAGIKLSLQTAIVISILVAFFVDLVTHFDVKEVISRTKAVYEGMGKVFTSTVALICCAELFALGMTKVGGISTMIQAAASMESAGIWVMLFVMIAIMVIATIVTGSGNAAFFAFSPLLPEAAASVGMNAAVLAVPVQLSAGLARTMCPIAGVMIAVSSIAGITPFQIVRRTIPVMIMALIVNIAASAIFL